MPATPVWLAAMEAVLNRSIGRSEQAQLLAHRLDGTSLAVEVEGFAPIRAAVSQRRLALTAAGGGADTRISGPPSALFKLLTDGTARTAAHVAGDAEIAGRYRELFALARPDLEEELSRLVGDLPARRLSLAAQGAAGWIRKLGRTFGENVAEYLQEESRDLVGKTEVGEFLQDVDRLRESADRVEARLARTEQRLKDATG